MKIKRIMPVLLAFVLLCVGHVESASAYFTTYVTAMGGYPVSWEHHEKIHEDFQDWKKYVTISSDPDSIPVYVRAKAFSGSTYQLSYSGSEWKYTEKDQYCYYQKALNGGETTSALLVSIDNIPINPEKEDNFNVIVIYECIPVIYDEDGQMVPPEQADWSKPLTQGKEEHSNEE